MKKIENEKVNKYLSYLITLVFDAILGTIIGLVIGLYQMGIHYIEQLNEYIYTSKNMTILSIMLVVVILLSIFNFMLIKASPNIEGSGMPNLILGIRKHKNIEWKKGIINLILNSYISTFDGFPLGSEGISIVIAGKIGKMSQDLTKKDDSDDLYLATGAGFGASYISPLSGLFYVFEEAFKKFKFKLLPRAIVMTSMSALICYLLNHHQLLELHSFALPSYDELYMLILLMAVNIPICYIFFKLIIFFKEIFLKYDHIFIIKYRAFIFFPIIFVLNIFLFQFMGSGAKIVEMDFIDYPVYIILAILVFRILITAVFGTGKVSGGLIIPIMTIGALTGEICASIGTSFFNMPSTSYSLVILISMCMVLAIINKCPLTATALVLTTIFNYTYNIVPCLILLPFTLISFVMCNLIFKQFEHHDLYDSFATLNLVHHLKSMKY